MIIPQRRRAGKLTPACRERLRDPAREFHLLLNGRGAYELVELTPAPVAGATAPVSAFAFERGGETYATWWHTSGSATLKLPAAVTLLARIDEAQRETVCALLAQDPRPSYQDDPQRVYGMAYGRWNIRFTVEAGTAHVVDVETA